MCTNLDPYIDSIYKPSEDKVRNIFKDLKNQFVCASCQSNLLPPIKTCRKGHNICYKCNMYSTCAACDISTQKVLRDVELQEGCSKVNYATPLLS